MPPKDKTLLMSELLNFHLSRSIERHSVVTDNPVNKFSETADRFKKFRAKREERLDDLNKKMDSHEPKEDEVFRKYEGAVEEWAAQMKQFEADAALMRNSIEDKTDDKEGGETGSTVAKFPETGPQAKVGTG
jgi:hypothetical protein